MAERQASQGGASVQSSPSGEMIWQALHDVGICPSRQDSAGGTFRLFQRSGFSPTIRVHVAEGGFVTSSRLPFAFPALKEIPAFVKALLLAANAVNADAGHGWGVTQDGDGGPWHVVCSRFERCLHVNPDSLRGVIGGIATTYEAIADLLVKLPDDVFREKLFRFGSGDVPELSIAEIGGHRVHVSNCWPLPDAQQSGHVNQQALGIVEATAATFCPDDAERRRLAGELLEKAGSAPRPALREDRARRIATVARVIDPKGVLGAAGSKQFAQQLDDAVVDLIVKSYEPLPVGGAVIAGIRAAWTGELGALFEGMGVDRARLLRIFAPYLPPLFIFHHSLDGLMRKSGLAKAGEQGVDSSKKTAPVKAAERVKGAGGGTDLSTDRGRSLIAAASEGSVERVKKLLDTGASLEFRDDRSGLTPLTAAASNGHHDAVHLLLARGANPLVKTTKEGRTASQCALAGGAIGLSMILTSAEAKAGAAATATGGTSPTQEVAPAPTRAPVSPPVAEPAVRARADFAHEEPRDAGDDDGAAVFRTGRPALILGLLLAAVVVALVFALSGGSGGGQLSAVHTGPTEVARATEVERRSEAPAASDRNSNSVVEQRPTDSGAVGAVPSPAGMGAATPPASVDTAPPTPPAAAPAGVGRQDCASTAGSWVFETSVTEAKEEKWKSVHGRYYLRLARDCSFEIEKPGYVQANGKFREYKTAQVQRAVGAFSSSQRQNGLPSGEHRVSLESSSGFNLQMDLTLRFESENLLTGSFRYTGEDWENEQMAGRLEGHRTTPQEHSVVDGSSATDGAGDGPRDCATTAGSWVFETSVTEAKDAKWMDVRGRYYLRLARDCSFEIEKPGYLRGNGEFRAYNAAQVQHATGAFSGAQLRNGLPSGTLRVSLESSSGFDLQMDLTLDFESENRLIGSFRYAGKDWESLQLAGRLVGRRR